MANEKLEYDPMAVDDNIYPCYSSPEANSFRYSLKVEEAYRERVLRLVRQKKPFFLDDEDISYPIIPDDEISVLKALDSIEAADKRSAEIRAGEVVYRVVRREDKGGTAYSVQLEKRGRDKTLL